jgi:hypothetical protein
MALMLFGMALGHGTVILVTSNGQWQLWFAAQVFAGAPAWICEPISDYLSRQGQGIDWADRLHETGTLYTAVAGFLNILIMMDAYLKADNPRQGSPKEAS